MLADIGSKLRIMRKGKKMTIQELSERTQLSTGYLSTLERNKRSPTINNLQKICKALDITINDFFELTNEKFCVKKDERKVAFIESDVIYEIISEGHRTLQGMCMTIKDNGITHDSFKHKSDEIGIIVKGSIEIKMNDEVYVLEEGDTIYIPADYDHSFRKLSEDDCISYWIVANCNVTDSEILSPTNSYILNHLK